MKVHMKIWLQPNMNVRTLNWIKQQSQNFINLKNMIVLRKFKLRNRYNHCQSKVTQCEKSSIFLKYNCFYCDNTFNSMDAHPSDCQDQFNIIFQSQASFQTKENCFCEMCDRSFNNVEEIESWASRKWSLLLWHLPLYFQSDRDLQFHIRGCHWHHM